MILPDSSSLKPRRPPVTTFYAFDNGSRVRATNATGVELATFMVDGDRSAFTITRQLPNAQSLPICTAHRSSLSSTTTMVVRGQQAQFKVGLEYELDSPMGKFKWRGTSSRERELIDIHQQVIGVANFEASKLEVLVGGDETFLDCLLSGWIAVVMAKNKSEKDSKAALTGFKIISALAGGGGA